MNALDRITIFPIKSLDGVDLNEVAVLSTGALGNDRRWAIVDDQGRYINGKRTPAIHAIRANYSSSIEVVALSTLHSQPITFDLKTQVTAASQWLSNQLQFPCQLIENRQTGFPDDLDAPGPTLVSNSTLQEVGRWFGISAEEARRRFRANLVIEADEPFWEDRLFGSLESPVAFTLGEVRMVGVNPCQRCAVPSRNPQSGEAMAGFQRRFAEQRQASLPPWAMRERFDHYYRLAINTRLSEENTASRLRLGDKLHHLAPRS